MSSASINPDVLSMFCREKWPPPPKVTKSNCSRFFEAGGVLISRRMACSIKRLTDVPDSAARFFSCANSRSSKVMVVRMMLDHTACASVHQICRSAHRGSDGPRNSEITRLRHEDVEIGTGVRVRRLGKQAALHAITRRCRG